MPEQLMTIKDTCTYLQIGRTLFYRLVSEEELPVVRVGGSLRVRPDALKSWLLEREIATMDNV